jgi:hypothetical protein
MKVAMSTLAPCSPCHGASLALLRSSPTVSHIQTRYLLRAFCRLTQYRIVMLSLAIQFEEHIGLAAQDIRFDRLTDEVHCAGLVSSKAALTRRCRP